MRYLWIKPRKRTAAATKGTEASLFFGKAEHPLGFIHHRRYNWESRSPAFRIYIFSTVAETQFIRLSARPSDGRTSEVIHFRVINGSLTLYPADAVNFFMNCSAAPFHRPNCHAYQLTFCAVYKMEMRDIFETKRNSINDIIIHVWHVLIRVEIVTWVYLYPSGEKMWIIVKHYFVWILYNIFSVFFNNYFLRTFKCAIPSKIRNKKLYFN